MHPCVLRIRSVVVAGFPDTGIFLDGSQFGLEWYKQWQRADALWGTTAAGHTNKHCLEAYSSNERWQCLFGDKILPHISTKLFALNSDIDMWSVDSVVVTHKS